MIAPFLLAVHAPALALGGNRFGLILPTAALILALLIVRAPQVAPPRFAFWLWLGVGAWGAAQIGLDLTPDPGEAARILARYALYAGVFLIAADVAGRPFQGGALVRATAIWIALVCLYGIIAWATETNPILNELEAYPTPLEATFVNRNAFALYAVFGLLASLSAMTRRWRISAIAGGGWIWAAMALICGVALVLTESRGGLVAGVVGLAVFAAVFGGFRLLSILSIAALICVGLVGEGYLRDAPVFDDPRFAIHSQVLAETIKTPLAGHGLGAFQDAFRAMPGGGWRWGDWDHAHQQYLETAYELGWPATVALCMAVAFAAPRPLRGDPVTALALAALAAAAAHAMVDFSLTIPSNAMTLALFLGAACGRQRRAG